MSRLEFVGGLYYDEDLGPCVPSWNVVRCIQEGGKRESLNSNVARSKGLVGETQPANTEQKMHTAAIRAAAIAKGDVRKL
jgi:hypothetical protein